MKKLNASWLLSIFCLSITATAKADDLRLGEPGYAGTGCPQGSVSAVLSPDQKSLSILFDSYQAQAGGDTRLRIDRKNCSVAIPVHVPHGYSISVYKVDYRGYTFVPSGGMARFNVEYFFAGYLGPRGSRTFMGPVNGDYLISNDVGVSAMVWSPCGADTNMRINTSMLAQTNSRYEQTLATVDSTDVRSSIVYRLAWRQCQ